MRLFKRIRGYTGTTSFKKEKKKKKKKRNEHSLKKKKKQYIVFQQVYNGRWDEGQQLPKKLPQNFSLLFSSHFGLILMNEIKKPLDEQRSESYPHEPNVPKHSHFGKVTHLSLLNFSNFYFPSSHPHKLLLRPPLLHHTSQK